MFYMFLQESDWQDRAVGVWWVWVRQSSADVPRGLCVVNQIHLDTQVGYNGQYGGSLKLYRLWTGARSRQSIYVPHAVIGAKEELTKESLVISKSVTGIIMYALDAIDFVISVDKTNEWPLLFLLNIYSQKMAVAIFGYWLYCTVLSQFNAYVPCVI